MFGSQDAFFSQRNKISIPQTATVVIVSDMFVEDYVGGAELTTQALIDSSPFEVFKLHSKDVSMDLLKQGIDKFWIFGNFTALDSRLIPSIVGNLKYSILEYDYKFCRFRSPEKHFASTSTPCDCHNDGNGKMVSAFFYGAMGLFWMSDKQKEKYHTLFPFLAEKDNRVLSSVFSNETLGMIATLRNAVQPDERKKWIVLGSNSWVKGASAAETWCKEHNKDYEVVWNLPYNELLAKLASSRGFVYLPSGGDTCPRMVIEAKLLGCEVVLNDHVQHKDEEWFATDDLDSISDYLQASPKIFWNSVKHMMDYKPTISGYMTTYNAASQGYPYKQAIQSMASFCDEICIVDGGSKDGTIAHLAHLAYPGIIAQLAHLAYPGISETYPEGGTSIGVSIIMMLEAEARQAEIFNFPKEYAGFERDPRIKVKVISRDWDHPRFAVFDGMQKAEARKMCTSDFCWQMDSDEVVHEDDAAKITQLCRKMPKEVDVISLPVIEYWGDQGKVRMDVMPWKWRLSRNNPAITHGIPVELRLTDSDGNVYAREGTDGCDMVYVESGERVPHVSFYNDQVEGARRAAMSGNVDAKKAYEAWFNDVVSQLPGVFHYSWHNLSRKIKLYKNYWTKHWNSLYGKSIDDTAENNMMFDLPWSEVTDEMIEERAKQLSTIGGWIWHSKWPGVMTPHMSCSKSEPKFMKGE